jgi:uncharacterized membrane protein SirB2
MMAAPRRRGFQPRPDAMNYFFLKYVHLFCVAGSFALFFVRGLWIARSYPAAPEAWVKALPHVVDGLLVLSAVGMVVTAPRFDWPQWMLVKLGLIVVYFGLAVLVFRAKTRTGYKILAWVGGLLLFLYVTTVAVLQHPLGVFSLF